MNDTVLKVVHSLDEPALNFDDNTDSIIDKLKAVKEILDMSGERRKEVSEEQEILDKSE